MVNFAENIKIILLNILFTVAVCKNGHSEAESSSQNQYRLSSSIVPLTYDIQITNIDFTENKFKGKVKIAAQVVRNTSRISLHVGKTMSVTKTRVVDQNDKSSKVKENSYNFTTEIWRIILKDRVSVSTILNISILYNGILRTDMYGFYKSSYIDESGREICIAGTQFQPVYARHAFPCFDEPIYKAKFRISILPPDGYHCLSNMPRKNTSIRNCTFEESVSMSTYLVAFVISNFKSRSKNSFRVWSRPSALEQTSYSLNIGTKALSYFGKLFNLPYQLEKMDMVALPNFAHGAMENWGLVIYREASILYGEEISSDVDKQKVAITVVNKCSHMWLGNLVTVSSWAYMWLKEGFSSYFEYLAVNKIEKDWKMEEQFVVDRHQIVLASDALADSQAMRRPDRTTEEINQIGGLTVASKAACIIRMLHKTFGSKIFKSALRNFISDRKYKTVTPAELWQAFQLQIDAARINVSVETFMQNWVETAGFPCVSVIIKPNVIILKQERFLMKKPKPISEEQIWSIPITWLTSTQANSGATPSTKPVHWLSSRDANWSIENQDAEWTILNVHSAGYYRVNYDKDSWNKIIETLTNGNFEKIPVLNRAAIVDDLMNLARSGLLDYDTALRGLQYLKRETNYLPFKSAFTSLDYLMRLFSTSKEADTFKMFVINLFEKVYTDLSYDDNPSDDRFTILLRQEINERACNLQYPQCIEKSKAYFNLWMANKIPIPNNQRATAYCTAIKYGSDGEWNFLWKQYQKASLAAEQVTILKALGCSTNTKILQKYVLTALKDFSSSLIQKQSINAVFTGIYSTSIENAEFIIEFVSKKYDVLNKYFGGHSEIVVLILNAMLMYPSKRLLEKVEKVMKTDKRIAKFDTYFTKGFKDVTAEIAWCRWYLAVISNWIRTN